MGEGYTSDQRVNKGDFLNSAELEQMLKIQIKEGTPVVENWTIGKLGIPSTVQHPHLISLDKRSGDASRWATDRNGIR